jgi:hypothetical protein
VHHTGLIRWKIVIHGFIDGKTRLIVGLRANNNNRARTVLELFHESTAVHGVPSRIRGDHGTENIEVARWMDTNQGVGHYIWGRSVHNTRIERLWVDVTRGLGKKWKDLFVDLEAHHGLNVDLPAHIWLLHHLFLNDINEDAIAWAEYWNSHKMVIPGERSQTPHEMFFLSMIRDGVRGLTGDEINTADDDIDGSEYGIDWEALHEIAIRQHHDAQSHGEYVSNPFELGPKTLTHVPCDAPPCPLNPHQLVSLNLLLQHQVNQRSRNMLMRRQSWIAAMAAVSTLFS